MTRITQQKQKFKALGIILKSESQIRTDSGVGTDGVRISKNRVKLICLYIHGDNERLEISVLLFLYVVYLRQ